MKLSNKLALLLVIISVVFASCSKNYYSGSGKGGKNCGCPSHKGMTGY